jgi:DNA ligase 1
MQEFWEKAVESRCEGLMIKVGARNHFASQASSLICPPKLLDSGHSDNVDGKKTRYKPLLATYEPGTVSCSFNKILAVPIRYEMVPVPLSDKRTTAWLKLKKDYVAGISDSLDLGLHTSLILYIHYRVQCVFFSQVPVGAWHGNGRKAQWWSPILLAIMDPSTGALIAVCKCMSGK